MSPGAESHVRVTQVRSGIGTKPKHRATLRALGLRGIGRSRVIADSSTLRGMVACVAHLVEVEPAAGPEPRPARRSESQVKKEGAR